MKHKQQRLLCAALALLMTAGIMAGCAANEEPSSSAAEPSPTAAATPEATATPSPEPEEKLAVIGTESSKETVLKVVLENGTKQDITAVAVKDSSLEEFPESMLKDKDVFAADEKRELYYDSESAVKAAEEAQQGDSDKLLEPQYDVQITLKDGTVLVLHAFPFGDMEEGVIKVEEEVAYLEYTSVGSKQKVSTKDAELAVKEAAEAQAQAEEPSYEPEYTPAESYVEYVPEPEPQPEVPSDNGNGGGEEGCLDGALFN